MGSEVIKGTFSHGCLKKTNPLNIVFEALWIPMRTNLCMAREKLKLHLSTKMLISCGHKQAPCSYAGNDADIALILTGLAPCQDTLSNRYFYSKFTSCQLAQMAVVPKLNPFKAN